MFACCSEEQNQAAFEITTTEAAVSEKPAVESTSAAEPELVVEEKQEEKKEDKTDEKIEQKIEEEKEEEKAAVIELAEIEVSFPINGQPLGLSLDLANSGELGVKIIKVKAEGAVPEYNKTAATPVKEGQTIMEVLGTRGNAQELLGAMKANKADKMTLKLC